ncbi:hypothetical protein MZM54_08655 [[Brevibacterium] frigoritolerans]|nr:hypothetical protein [Peribacillus frigoritolerans]
MSLLLLIVNSPFTREFAPFTREFTQFTREFTQFTREFAQFKPRGNQKRQLPMISGSCLFGFILLALRQLFL